MFSIQNAVGKASGADCCGCRHIGQTKVSARLCFSVTDRFRLEDQRGVAGLRAQPPQTIAYQPAAAAHSGSAEPVFSGIVLQ